MCGVWNDGNAFIATSTKPKASGRKSTPAVALAELCDLFTYSTHMLVVLPSLGINREPSNQLRSKGIQI
jgi:hypothetical protein